MKQGLRQAFATTGMTKGSPLRRAVNDVLESGIGHDVTSRLVNSALIILIFLNVVAFAAQTVPELDARYGGILDLFNLVSVVIFTIEYGLRLWSCVEIPGLDGRTLARARTQFALRPLLVIDLLAILPFYLGFLFSMDLRVLRVLRLFRFFKLARYSPALQTLWRVVRSESRALLGALLVMVSLILFAATGIYYIERAAQPEVFGSIPAAAWWALSTLTTVGYGDVVPVTVFGRLFGGLIMIFGLGMFALPIAIIATGFAQETGRHAFVVTWSMVAQVPMFRGLDPSEIAEITTLLHSQSLTPDTIIYRTGEVAEAMYFIVSGEVRIERGEDIFVLGKGSFFGELALLEKRAHGADATTSCRTSLLALGLEDFDFLLRRNPRINQRLREEAQLRLSEGELRDDFTV